MFYYLYQITNLVNAKIYVGVHKTRDMNDGYMGSGKVILSAIKKHGINNFQKVILETFQDETSMYAREKEVVTEEFLSRNDVYNLRRGGTGGFDYINKKGLNGTQKGVAKAKTLREKDSIWRKNWEQAQVKGARKRIAETPKKVLQERTAKAMKTKFVRYGHVGTFNGKTHTYHTKLKQSIAAKLRMQDFKNNPSFGTMWITNGNNNLKIPKTNPIPKGWYKGRVLLG